MIIEILDNLINLDSIDNISHVYDDRLYGESAMYRFSVLFKSGKKIELPSYGNRKTKEEIENEKRKLMNAVKNNL